MTNWTHVKDFMPVQYGRYLVASGDGVEIAELQPLNKWYADSPHGESDREIKGVTHWAPLLKHPEAA